MEDRALNTSPSISQSAAPTDSSPSSSKPASTRHFEGRGAWVLTAYGVSGLALFGVLAYFFSDFIAH
jgi:hypothetical protein